MDDHRSQSPAIQPLNSGQALRSTLRIQDFDETAADEGPLDASPGRRRGRQATIASTERRAVSPPSSVKAFAEARRREREHEQGTSSSEPNKGEAQGSEEDGLARTTSNGSCPSQWSRLHVLGDDSGRAATNRFAEEDAPDAVQEERWKDKLHIDFDCLETLLAKSEESQQPTFRVFPNLRPDATALPHLPTMTADGDLIDVPSDQEKEECAAPSVRGPRQPADPNRFSFFSTAWESTIHAAVFGDLVLPGEDLQNLFRFPKGDMDGVWWLNVNNPTEEEIRVIGKAFGIHPLTIEDINTKENREKIELFPTYYFASFTSFNCVNHASGIQYTPFNIYAVVFREGTLSFSFTPNTHASQVRTRISRLKDCASLSSDWICYALIDDIVDSFAPAIRQIEHDADTIEDEMYIARLVDMQVFLRKIGMARRNVMGLMRLLGGKADVLRGFAKRCNENYKVTPHTDIGLYLGDIEDHGITMMNNLVHFDKMLSRSQSNYLAQLSIDRIAQGNQTNESLSRVTVIATILVPLNVICGLFGMNVNVPWQDEDNVNAWLGILSGIILFPLLCLLIARRLRYI